MTIGEIKRTDDEWHAFFFQMAVMWAHQSKDPDRKVGAIIVDERRRPISHGYNGFPVGVTDTKDRMKNLDIKIPMMVHAEVNAILNSITSTQGCALYSTSFPCASCSGVIIQAGIKLLLSPPIKAGSKWESSSKLGADMMYEAGVEIYGLDTDETDYA